MKKLLLLSLSLFLALACQKAENVLGIDPDAPLGAGDGDLPTVVSIDPANGTQLFDNDIQQSGIQGKIEIVFSDFMDAATVTPTGNITITNTTLDDPVTGFTTEYYPEIKKLFIFIDDVASGSGFSIELAGFTNTYGSPLDFDGDNIADPAPYDNYLSTFFTQGYTDTLIATVWPEIADLDPYLIRTAVQQPTIVLQFANTGIRMDSVALKNMSNFDLRSDGGTAYPLQHVSHTNTSVTLQPTGNLPYGSNYTFTITCSELKKIAKSVTPDYLLVLDGNDNGPESAEPDTGGYFRVDTVIPPTVDVSQIANGARFTFSKKIDEATLSLATLKVFDDDGYVPGELRIYAYPDTTPTYVEYYYKRAIAGSADAFASRTIKQTAKDYYLDGNGNQIGSEPQDDDWEYNF